jgi:hypothetical protein
MNVTTGEPVDTAWRQIMVSLGPKVLSSAR